MLSLFLYSTANPNWISHSHTLLLNSRWLNSLCWQFQLLCFWHCGRACNFYSLTVESLCFFVWWSLSILWSWLFHIVFPLLPSPQPHFLFRSHPWQQPKTYQVPRQVNITPPPSPTQPAAVLPTLSDSAVPDPRPCPIQPHIQHALKNHCLAWQHCLLDA